MFVSDESIMVIAGLVTALTMIQGKSHNTLRRRKVEGSIHQYNISPSQTMWSTRFYTPEISAPGSDYSPDRHDRLTSGEHTSKTDHHPGAIHIIHPQKSQRSEPIILLAHEETHQIQRWNTPPPCMYTNLDDPN